MAGERAHLEGFREITAVCTRPSHRRRGYGRALVHALATSRVEEGETPFLHVPRSNHAAIELYRSLGFVPRRRLMVTVLRKPTRDA